MAFFGQGALTDVYKQSFIIPDTLYFLIAGGALSSAFIPVFTKYFTEGNEEDAWKTFSIVCSVAFLATAAFVVVGEIWAAPLSRLVSPGFMPEQVRQMANLTRIVLPAQMFFFMGGLMMGCLYSRHKFVWPALGPLIYTVGIIAGGCISWFMHRHAFHILRSPEIVHAMKEWATANAHNDTATMARLQPTVNYALRIGTPAVAGFSWGALIGAFIGNFMVQLFAMRKIGMRFRPCLEVTHPGASKVFKLMLPVILGLSLPQVDVQINKYFASMLNSGSVTALDNANRLMQVPYGVLGTSFAIALFPTLSALAAQRLWGDYRLQISQGIRRVTFMSLPCSVLLMVLAWPAVRLVFQHGRLVSSADVRVTALTLVLFAVGVPMWCLQAIIARGFYALHDTLTVVITGTIMTIIFVGLSVGFIHVLHNPKAIWWAPAGLALITSIAAGLHSVVLIWILRNRIGGINGRHIVLAVGKMTAACLIMAAVTLPLYLRLDSPISRMLQSGHVGEMKRLVAAVVELGIPGGVGLLVYAGAAKALKLEELENALSMFLGKFRRKATATAA